MITLRQASLPTSLMQSNSNRQESGIGQPLSIRRAVSPLIKSASGNIVSHPLLKASRTGNTNRKSSAETALTLVQAYAKLTGSEDATSNLAERRGSAMAVIVTGQGSHEIIWRYDDTPSSNSSSSSGRQSRIAEAVVSSPQITAA